MMHGPALRAEAARRVTRIAATYPAVSIRLRSGDVEVSGDSADSIVRLGWRRGADLDVSCSGPGESQHCPCTASTAVCTSWPWPSGMVQSPVRLPQLAAGAKPSMPLAVTTARANVRTHTVAQTNASATIYLPCVLARGAGARGGGGRAAPATAVQGRINTRYFSPLSQLVGFQGFCTD